MASVEDRIATLEARLKQEKAKKAQIEARQRAAQAKKTRAEDTRKKVLVGAVVLARVARGDWPADRFREMMDKALTRADDRALFDLAPLPVAAEPTPEKTA